MSVPTTTVTEPLPPLLSPLRRVFKHRRLMHHNRLAAAVVLGNLGVLALAADWWFGDLDAISTMVLADFALAVLIRQQYVINALFLLATSAPTRWPLRLRWTLGKVYHLFGGLHVGGALAATGWFLIFAVSATTIASGLVLVLTYVIAGLLLALIVMALPARRARRHDRFELTHRFGGWAVLALVWAHSLAMASDGVVTSPQIWVLVVITGGIALPWLRLRRVPVEIVTPSRHVALLTFDYGVTPFAGSSTTISRNPLRQWHSFANVPSPNQDGFRLTVSRAGDWTGQFIDDRPTHVWVKGIPTAGVGNIDRLFTKVVWVATGSGIGPCLPHLLSQQVPSRLVWSTRDPHATYGQEMVEEILAVQTDPVIWDTTTSGKPDLVRLAVQAYQDFGAEAVICISNKATTWTVVQQLEMRGIPAFGAIWDS